MTFSFRRMNAIFQKDWKELYKNSYILFTLAMPLAFAAFLGRIGEDASTFHSMPITLALVIAGVFIQAAMIAEEKEKNTLRGLLLSPASTSEILIGKSALTFVMTVFVIIGSIFLSDFQVTHVPLFALIIIINLIFYISMGTILGLLSRTVMETTIIGMPVMVIFGLAPMFVSMIENKAILKIVQLLPSEHFTAAWTSLSNGKGFAAISGNIFTLFIWAAASLVVTFIVYEKRQFDR
ncbi:ABC transporter permease [Lederbergia citrea]|uniref:ABC transporter permease n=1 Tax=Lederbergia citrea TaxID=2833581 RepID=A0A942Z3E5_9BACI|nr:ABC transporter permease [Lederbergia citrea]MBS4204655.1 ABC transporter permease [Lederbergia citrea]MBS4223498.1 ABC transporter permease [Lederbergia citrea]